MSAIALSVLCGPLPCRHCKKVGTRTYRRRGLCWTCYHSPPIRKKYQSTSKMAFHYGEVPVSILFGSGQLPAAPTPHMPGSNGKILVMVLRAAQREVLFHPQDARIGD